MNDHNEDGVFDAQVREAFGQEIPSHVRSRLEPMFAIYEHGQAERSLGKRVAALFVPTRRWSPRYASVVLILLATASLGAYIAHKYQFISEGFARFGVEVSPEDGAIESAVKAYMADHDGLAPTEFRQLTTPIAYFAGPWDPAWQNKLRECSEQETAEWESLPKWAKGEWAGAFGQYEKWAGLSREEWPDWVRWHVQRQIDSNLAVEWFSPEQKDRVLRSSRNAEAELLKALPDLVENKTPKAKFDQAVISIWARCVLDPMQEIFKEMRLERRLIQVRMGVDRYSKRNGRPPMTLRDVAGVLPRGPERDAVERLSDRPLNDFESMNSKWDKPSAELNWYDWRSYGEPGSSSSREILDGWLPWRVDLYFQGYLPYYDFTEEEQSQIQQIRDETCAELKSALMRLAERKTSRRTFEQTFAEIRDKRIEEFHPIFEKMLARAAKP